MSMDNVRQTRELVFRASSLLFGIDKSPCTGVEVPLTSAAEDDKINLRVSWKSFFELFTGKEKALITVGSIFASILGLLQPISSVVLSTSLTKFGKDNTANALIALVVSYTIIAIVAAISGFIYNYTLEYVIEKKSFELRMRYVKALLRQEVGYYDMKDLGTLGNDLEASIVLFRYNLGAKTAEIFRSSSLILLAYIVGFSMNWILTLTLSAMIPCIAVALSYAIVAMKSSDEKSKNIYSLANAVVEESLTAIKIVNAFNIASIFSKKYNMLLDQWERIINVAIFKKSIGFACLQFFLYLSYAFGWIISAKYLGDHIKSEGESGYDKLTGVLAVFFAITMASFSFGLIGPNLESLLRAKQTLRAIFNLSERESSIDPYLDVGNKLDRPVNGKIEVQNISFAYPARPDHLLFNNLSLTINAGETVAFVGTSGCGKSTLIQLFERFYDVTGGTILFDGENIQSLNLKSYRKNISLVSQEPRLFSTTIKENIVMGKPDATEEEIILAAKKAHAHNFIMKQKDQYDTYVGAGGNQLSGGQKQRIAIARAIIRNPSVLLLDEATSALDNKSERVVQNALDSLFKTTKMTTVIIAHRLSTIRNVDRIIVFTKSSTDSTTVIAEEGSHTELMNIENGIYKSLVEGQKLTENNDDEKQVDNLDATTIDDGELDSNRKASSFLVAMEETSTKPEEDKIKLRMLYKNNYGSFFIGLVGECIIALLPTISTLMITSFIITVMTVIFAANGDYIQAANQIFDETKYIMYVYLIMAYLGGITPFISIMQEDKLSCNIVKYMRSNVYEELLYREIEFYDKPQNNVGYFSNLLAADCEIVRQIIGTNFFITFRTAITMCIAGLVSSVYYPTIGIFCFCIYAVLLPAFILQLKYIKSISVQSASKTDPTSPPFILNDITMNVKVIAAYSLQDVMTDKYEASLQKYYKIAKKNIFITSFSIAFAEAMPYLSYALSYGWTTYLTNKMSAAELRDNGRNILRAVMVISTAGTTAARTATFLTDTKKGKLAFTKLQKILNSKSTIDNRFTDGEKLDIVGNIGVNNVKFRYPSRPTVPVLDNIDFKIPANTAVALVGESGSGKSTIIQLLERYYELKATDTFIEMYQAERQAMITNAEKYYKGSVTIDNLNIDKLNIAHLRSQIGLVMQEATLFSDSIKENIRYGKLNATDEEIYDAAKLAGAHNFILSLPDGYETNVGFAGTFLSGGQKQRIAIARALIRKPKILLLDEATSALDTESEKIVQETIDDITRKKQCTIIVIAHRLSTIRNLDYIYVFKATPGVGSIIIESGTHNELMKKQNGYYRSLALSSSN